MHSCNSATGIGGGGDNYTFTGAARIFSFFAKISVTGWIGTSSYSGIYDNGLPPGGIGAADNDVGPGNKGKSNESRQATFENGIEK